MVCLKCLEIYCFLRVQVCEGLAFLHDSVKMIHRNISLGTVILNEAGAWKIFGFDFCLANVAPVGQPPAWNFPVADQMLPASEFGQPGYGFWHLNFTRIRSFLKLIEMAKEIFEIQLGTVNIKNISRRQTSLL